MNVLVIVLNDLVYLDEILEKFVDLKVRGATIIESQGMASAILNSEGLNFLMQGLFKGRTDEEQKYSKTIFTVIPDEETLVKTVEAVRKIVERSRKKTVGFMFTLPVSGIYPLTPKKK
ncbi:MAG: hypothetical protein ACOX5X_01555 [Acholeplasmataceae bacterium]|jgi:hypothetical protein